MAGYIRSIGDKDYNFGYNDFTVEFFAKTNNSSPTQTLFEITNNESYAANNYIQTRFITSIINGNINSKAVQTNTGNILFSIDGVYFQPNISHYISTERKDNNFYLFFDGVSQSQPVNIANIAIPSQSISNISNLSQTLLRIDSPALLTIGADKNGGNILSGSIGDFRITNGVARHVYESKIEDSISSSFTDNILGTRSSDINIYGGGFIDSVTSHTPEELIPIQLFDAINISVYQNSNCANLSSNISNISAYTTNIANPSFNSNSVILGFRIFKDTIETGPIGKYNLSNVSDGTFVVPWANISSDSASILVNGNALYSNSWTITNHHLTITNIPINSNISIVATGPTSYYSIGANAVTTLTQNLYSSDSTISVANVSGFITPTANSTSRGKLFINEECITYLYIDRIHNVFSGIRRGVNGTGTPNIHIINSQIISASMDRILPGTPNISTWYNLSNTNLAATSSTISSFLVDQGTVPPA